MSTNRKKRTPSTPRPASAISDKVKVTVSLTADLAQRLESLAKELGVSKSELFERLGKGELNLSAETPETAPAPVAATVETSNVESSALSSENVALKQQVEEQANTIQQLQQQLTRISELEAQLGQTVDSATHEALKQEAEQQKQTITNLQHQLEQKVTQTVDAEAYQALQNELEQQRTIQSQLNQQIKTLEKDLNASNGSLSQLQMKQEKIAELEVKLAHSISTESYQQLEQICATQKAQMATIEQKLASLVSTKTQHDASPNTTVNYDALKTYLQEQDTLIDTLQKRVLELQGLACFGESQLSKWRHRTYNS